jgi:hypothetical protein
VRLVVGSHDVTPAAPVTLSTVVLPAVDESTALPRGEEEVGRVVLMYRSTSVLVGVSVIVMPAVHHGPKGGGGDGLGD